MGAGRELPFHPAAEESFHQLLELMEGERFTVKPGMTVKPRMTGSVKPGVAGKVQLDYSV